MRNMDQLTDGQGDFYMPPKPIQRGINKAAVKVKVEANKGEISKTCSKYVFAPILKYNIDFSTNTA